MIEFERVGVVYDGSDRPVLHDVTLSATEVRDVVWRELERWFRAYVPLPAPPEPEPGPARRGWWHRLLGR